MIQTLPQLDLLKKKSRDSSKNFTVEAKLWPHYMMSKTNVGNELRPIFRNKNKKIRRPQIVLVKVINSVGLQN